jgi:dTDP-4-dehydrorhamnose 3,5-epimerase
VLSEFAVTLYSCTDYYHPEYERTILWNDPDLAIDWPIKAPLCSEKDQRGLPFCEALYYEMATRSRANSKNALLRNVAGA